MTARQDDHKKRFGSNLEKVRLAREAAERQKRLLAEQLSKSQTKPAHETPVADTGRASAPAALELPKVRLYHRSDISSEVSFVAAASGAASTIVSSISSKTDAVIFSWPDKINRPLGVTISALLRTQSLQPRLESTVAYYPFSDRKIHSLKSIFVDEDDLAARYHKLITSMDRAEYGSTAYKNAYLLKGLKSAQPTAGRQVVGKPNLRELIPIFRPVEEHHVVRFGDRDDDFLGDVSAKKTLIREAAGYRKEIASKRSAPIAIFGLPESVDQINRLFKTDDRLRETCTVIIADATDVKFGAAAAWLKGLRRLAHIARGHKLRPPIVVITQDHFIAKAASEILSDRPDAKSKVALRRPTIRGLVKIVPNDFSAQPDAPATWSPVSVAVHLKEEELAEFRTAGLDLAGKLHRAGYAAAADAVVSAITFVRTVACLPVALSVLRDHLDTMEQAGAVSSFVAAPYRFLRVASLLKRAETEADSMGDLIHAFRGRVETLVERYAAGGEVAELVRELLERATKKANRTIIAFRDRVILSAFTAWLSDQPDIDRDRLDEKVLLTTTEALTSALSAVARGAPIDTLVVVSPFVKDLERIILSPALPRKVVLVGDAGLIGALGDKLGSVAPLLSAEPASRIAAVLKGLKECAGRFQAFDFEKVIEPEFSREMTLDFTVQDSIDEAYRGPVVELSTEDGYLLRLLPHADCLVLQDEDATPLRTARAENVKEGERIFIFRRALHDRLESLLGPVKPHGTTLLSSYHLAVRERVALISGNRQEQANEIVRRMKLAALDAGEAADLGLRESSNVLRWMSAGRVDSRPDAPRSPKTFALFMRALEVPEIISGQYWYNAVISTRVMAIQVGLHEHNRAQEFVMNPHGFYSRFAAEKPELQQLWEEMVRSASVVVRKQIVGIQKPMETVR
jgi:hypothetical protein